MSAALPISIALCTCNGERFLGEQLASLASQSYLPSELVVCDDASDDGTYKLLEDFARRAAFPVRLYRKQKRLGINQNFEQAIRLCTGSVIALCDQDDVWFPEKLARYAEFFASDVGWAFCDAQVMDATLLPLGYTLWEGTAFTEGQRQLARNGLFFEVLLKHYVVAGATMAFRSELRDQLLPIPLEWHYDAWLAAVLAATKKSTMVEACMQHYRQHDSNAIGMERRGLLSEIRAALDVDRTDYLATEIFRWQHLVGRLDKIETPDWVLSQLEAKCCHLLQRVAFPKSRLCRLPFVAAEIARGGYSRYSRNWGSVALDLLLK